ncbi:hypothetical protein ACJX0J_015759, partial [Zea mays]
MQHHINLKASDQKTVVIGNALSVQMNYFTNNSTFNLTLLGPHNIQFKYIDN